MHNFILNVVYKVENSEMKLIKREFCGQTMNV